MTSGNACRCGYSSYEELLRGAKHLVAMNLSGREVGGGASKVKKVVGLGSDGQAL